MRREEKRMSEEEAVNEVILRSQVCRLAMTDGMRPYIVPLCFGYEPGFLYFHCATQGRKLDLIGKNDCVCFEFDVDAVIDAGADACHWSMKFRSVIGYGKASLVEENEEKIRALDVIMRQYAPGEFTYSEKALERTAVIKVAIESISGKKSRY